MEGVLPGLRTHVRRKCGRISGAVDRIDSGRIRDRDAAEIVYFPERAVAHEDQQLAQCEPVGRDEPVLVGDQIWWDR